jgi:hypothetical protein
VKCIPDALSTAIKYATPHTSKLVEFVICEVLTKKETLLQIWTRRFDFDQGVVFAIWCAHFVCAARRQANACSNCKWQKLIKIPAKCVYNKVTLAPRAPSPY